MKAKSTMIRRVSLSFCFLAVVLQAGLCAEVAAAPAQLPAVRLGPKPVDDAVERRARPQPTVPEAAKEIAVEETTPEPDITALEKERGYVLFQRPVTECIYPNTRPLSDERLEALIAFAALGQFQPVTFGIYPTRGLQ